MNPYIIKISQCNIGQYNLLSSEKSLSFYMSIYTEDNKIYEEDGIKAQLYYSGDPDELYIFEDALNNLGEVFQKCFKYSNMIYSSTDYKSQCLLFAKVYHENFETLEINMKSKRNKDILEEIVRLQKKLSYGVLDDISYEVEDCINKEIKSNQKMIDYYLQKNSELKEGTETYNKNLEYISKYQKSNKHLNQNLIYETENN